MYLINMLIVLFLILSCLPTNIVLFHSLPKVIIYLRRYNILSPTILLSLLSLSGLPPISFFFLKFNIIIYLSSNLNNINIAIIFLFFLLNTFFYLQIFYHTNTTICNIDILKKQKKLNTNSLTLTITFFVVILLFFIYFFIFFFLDFFFIVCSLIV